MEMSEPSYSVVIPVFNSQQSLEELFLGIKSVFESENQSFDAVLVDDGSRDQSWSIIEDLKTKHPEQVIGIRLNKNYGQHNATLCGFSFARGKYIITIDDDLQTPPGEISKLIRTIETTNADLVYGYYTHMRQSVVRRVGSRSLKKSSGIFRDTSGEGSSFRLLTAELKDKLLSHHQHFIFIDEVLQWYTDDINFVEVNHTPRKYAKTKYTSGKIFNLVTNILIYYTTIPLKLMVFTGFTISILTLLCGVYYLFRKIFLHVPIPGYTSLIVAILFSTSIILFSLGVIGEYLGRIYEVQNKKPAFSIKKVI
jgi:glycosyltransferase involved in cell wall biosynthesis